MYTESMVPLVSEPSASVFLKYLLQIGWKGSLLLASALILNRLATRIAPATRCLLLLGACIGLVMVALLSPYLPEVDLPVIPESVSLLLNPEVLTTEARLETSRSQALPDRRSADPTPAVESPGSNLLDSKLIDSFRIVARRLGPWIPLIWLMGSVLFIGRLLAGHILAHLEARNATPLSDSHWSAILDSTTRRMGIREAIHLRVSPDQPVPKTIGLFSPVILLPSLSCGWSRSRKEAVLAHELAHVRRKDLAFHTLARFACALHWFNPLAWAAEGRLRLESERACDDEVLKLGIRPSLYARHLLSFAKYSARERLQVLASAAMVGSPDLEGRILSVLDTSRPRQSLSLKNFLLLGLFLCLIAIPLSSLTLGFVTQNEGQTEVEATESLASPPPPAPEPPPAPPAPPIPPTSSMSHDLPSLAPPPPPPPPAPPPPAPCAPAKTSSQPTAATPSTVEPAALPAAPAATVPPQVEPPPSPPAPPSAPQPPRQEDPATEEEGLTQKLAKTRRELSRIEEKLRVQRNSLLEPLRAELEESRSEFTYAREELEGLRNSELRKVRRQLERKRAEYSSLTRQRERVREELRDVRRNLDRVRRELQKSNQAMPMSPAPPNEP